MDQSSWSLQHHDLKDIQNYKAAWAYLEHQTELTTDILLHTANLLTLKKMVYDRKFTVRCGDIEFPPRKNMRRDVQNLLNKYKLTHDIAELVHKWLGYLHVFQDGNGRLCRLLISWHCKPKLILLKYNKIENDKWKEAVHSDTADKLRTLIAESCKDEWKVESLLEAAEDTTTTQASEEDSTTTTTRSSRCGFCSAGIIDCCNCPYRNEICHPSVRHY
jgi:hypothetical protein